MKKIDLPFASKLTSPNPVSLVCTRKPDGSTNLATVSVELPLLQSQYDRFCYGKTSYSGELVRSNHQVVLTIPGSSLAQAVMHCGSCSGSGY